MGLREAAHDGHLYGVDAGYDGYCAPARRGAGSGRGCHGYGVGKEGGKEGAYTARPSASELCLRLLSILMMHFSCSRVFSQPLEADRGRRRVVQTETWVSVTQGTLHDRELQVRLRVGVEQGLTGPSWHDVPAAAGLSRRASDKKRFLCLDWDGSQGLRLSPSPAPHHGQAGGPS